MSFFDVLTHRYQLSTIGSGRVGTTHAGLKLLSRPRPGSPLVMYNVARHRRIVTSRVVRVYSEAGVDGSFVETANSLYLLQLDRLPSPSHRILFRPCHELAV